MTLRTDRVGEAIREVIAAAVADLTDPRLGLVSITGVDIAPDMANAVVYYSTLGDDETVAATGEALTHAAGRLQRAVARDVRLKRTPRLRFAVDHGIVEGEHIDAVLREMGEVGGDRK